MRLRLDCSIFSKTRQILPTTYRIYSFHITPPLFYFFCPSCFLFSWVHLHLTHLTYLTSHVHLANTPHPVLGAHHQPRRHPLNHTSSYIYSNLSALRTLLLPLYSALLRPILQQLTKMQQHVTTFCEKRNNYENCVDKLHRTMLCYILVYLSMSSVISFRKRFFLDHVRP